MTNTIHATTMLVCMEYMHSCAQACTPVVKTFFWRLNRNVRKSCLVVLLLRHAAVPKIHSA